MSLRRALRFALAILLPLSIASTVYLYLYPVFNGCAFPSTHTSAATAFSDTLRQHLGRPVVEASTLAPFRLLTLADPQLEGDSSLPDPDDAFVPSLRRHWARIASARPSLAEAAPLLWDVARAVALRDLPKALQASRKRLDLFGNDYYLAHVFRTLRWWTRPTHVTVLGDLIGSQWVTDEEFEWRGWRYWERVFRGTSMVVEGEREGKQEVLDMTPERISRFERIFGRVNWDVKFRHHLPNTTLTPTIHLIVLNSLNLDTPVLSPDLQTSTYDFINGDVIAHSAGVEDRSTFTLLLTHLPLHKPAGVCVDPPFFDFYGSHEGGGIKEQNHLSLHVSTQGILEGIFGMSANRDSTAGGRGRNGIILTGHDHEGCDVWHYLPTALPAEGEEGYHPEQYDKPWRSTRYEDRSDSRDETGIREVTLRSMMGSYGGNAGLFSVWFDEEQGEWRFEMRMCGLGVQHWWWGVHVLDLVTLGLAIVVAVVEVRVVMRTGLSASTSTSTGTSVSMTPKKRDTVKVRSGKASESTLERDEKSAVEKRVLEVQERLLKRRGR